MKTFLSSILFSFLSMAMFAQLPNSSFETWSSSSFDEPTGWQTGNHEAISLGLIPVTKVTSLSGFAVRMETIVANGDTAQAYIANGDPMSGNGGIPCVGQPTAITGKYRYNLVNNDTAILLVIFKNSGVIFSSNIFKIHGTGSQNTFITFSFPLSLGIPADSVVIAAASSNLIDNVGVENGSFLELDDLAFTGTVSTIANNNFENWTTNSVDNLSGWETYGEGVTRTTDSHDGTYAISFTTIDFGNGDISSSGMTSGHNTQNGPSGGIPYTLSNDTLMGWYKYSSQCSDTAFGSVSLMSNGNNVGGNMLLFAPVSQYTFFQIPVWSQTTPDTMRVDFSSSKWPYTNSCDGSTLIIDELAMKSQLIAGTTEIGKKGFAFPNPAKNFLHIHGLNDLYGNILVEIYDLSGRLVLKERKQLDGLNDSIDISSLKPGHYYYRTVTSKGESMNSFSKE
jgi:hypothetical protein